MSSNTHSLRDSQSLNCGAEVAEVAYHKGLRYLLIRLASGGSRQLKASSPDLAALRAAEQQIQGLMITCAPGEIGSGSVSIAGSIAHCMLQHGRC